MNKNLIAQYKSELIQTAIQIKTQAYCIVSHFAVGAAILTKSGHIFSGVNVENRVLPCGWCAEVSACASAVSNGHRDFVACAVSTNADECVAPCGKCRQILAEFDSEGDMLILMIDRQGHVEEMRLYELLPVQFGKRLLPKLYE